MYPQRVIKERRVKQWKKDLILEDSEKEELQKLLLPLKKLYHRLGDIEISHRNIIKAAIGCPSSTVQEIGNVIETIYLILNDNVHLTSTEILFNDEVIPLEKR